MFLLDDERQWVHCQPGTFEMGDDHGISNEMPRYAVTITQSFKILKSAVTQELWGQYMNQNPSRFIGAHHPVDSVTWFDCIAFCNRLSEVHQKQAYYELKENMVICHTQSDGYRLPTESEWEYAAQAGRSYLYAGSDDISEVAWFGANEFLDEMIPQTHEVKQKKPNAWGLYDMSGNVWEWCMDAYVSQNLPDQRKGSLRQNPMVWDARIDQPRVLKGGCYWNLPKSCRISCRNQDLGNQTHDGRGVRVVQNLC
jgi:formylglycine-generating enzyme required for sulfatase activity